MKFGDFPIDVAEGAILAHGLRLGKRTFKKGRALTADDIAALRDAGRETVIAARLEADDVGEDEAALAVAEAALGEGLSRGEPFTGRCNLFAEKRGIAVLERERLDRLNLVDEAVTVATVPPLCPVEANQKVATIKVIPVAVARPVLDRCVAIAGDGGPLIRIARYAELPVGLVQTTLPGVKESVLDSTTETVRARLAGLGSHLAAEERCAHEAQAVAAAIASMLERGCGMLLIMGASAVVDRRDIVPDAIERVGGDIDHLGMPVDPGNLLLLGHLGPVPVIGLPGCARSPSLNGFDWVLQRLLAGLPVTDRDIMTMGAGGLLKEFKSRPLPRADASPRPRRAAAEPVAATSPRIAAMVLAAGQSRRMGRTNKLLAPLEGVPMVVRAVDAALASRARPVVVITGHEAERVRAALGERPAQIVHNSAFARGISTSLLKGLSVLPQDVDGALICLGDMPRIGAGLLNRLIDGFDPDEGRAIGVPTFEGKRGNPVLFAARFFAEMREIAGDVGARHLIGEHADEVYEIEGDESVMLDIDTPEALAAISSAGTSRRA